MNIVSGNCERELRTDSLTLSRGIFNDWSVKLSPQLLSYFRAARAWTFSVCRSNNGREKNGRNATDKLRQRPFDRRWAEWNRTARCFPQLNRNQIPNIRNDLCKVGKNKMRFHFPSFIFSSRQQFHLRHLRGRVSRDAKIVIFLFLHTQVFFLIFWLTRRTNWKNKQTDTTSKRWEPTPYTIHPDEKEKKNYATTVRVYVLSAEHSFCCCQHCNLILSNSKRLFNLLIFWACRVRGSGNAFRCGCKGKKSINYLDTPGLCKLSFPTRLRAGGGREREKNTHSNAVK